MIARRPAGGDLPHRADPLAVPGDVRQRAAAVPREAQRPDRGVAGRPQGDRRAPRRRRGGDPERRRGRRTTPTRCRCPAIPRAGRHDRLHRPLRRAPQGHGRARRRARAAGRASGPSCGCWSPGGARPRSSAPSCRRRSPSRSTCSARSARPTRPACCAASTSTARPNTGQESFGIILLEAMAAGTPIVASDLDAFRRVLHGGEVGRLLPGRRRGRRWPRRIDGAARRRAAARELRSRPPAPRRWRRSTGR